MGEETVAVPEVVSGGAGRPPSRAGDNAPDDRSRRRSTPETARAGTQCKDCMKKRRPHGLATPSPPAAIHTAGQGNPSPSLANEIGQRCRPGSPGTKYRAAAFPATRSRKDAISGRREEILRAKPVSSTDKVMSSAQQSLSSRRTENRRAALVAETSRWTAHAARYRLSVNEGLRRSAQVATL